MDITIMNRKLEVKYYKSLMSTLKKINEDYSWVEKHIHELENISSSNETEQVEEVKEEELVKENIQNNDHYKKPWTKLNIVHKILKMKEFINNLKEISTMDKEMLKEQLCQLIKDKVVEKIDHKNVNHDMVNGKIISLLDLQYKDNKYIYLSE